MKPYLNIKLLVATTFLSGLLLFSFVFKSGTSVRGTLKNSDENNYIYLYEFLGTELIKKDSVKNKEGSFTFTVKGAFPRGFYKIGPSIEKSVMLILSSESPVVSADLDNLPASIEIKNSKENTIYKEFKSINDRHGEFYNNVNKEAQLAQQELSNNPEAYKSKIQMLQNKLDSMNALRSEQYRVLAGKSKGLFMEKFINMFSLKEGTKESFFSTADFTDPELARGDMLPTKLSIYMQRFVGNDLESWKVEAENLLNKAAEKNSNKEVLFITIILNMVNSDIDFTRAIAKNYLKEFPESDIAQRYWKALPKEAPSVGEVAPDIVLNNPEGNSLSLSSLKGKVVLLDFWASWCGPCRRENPNVVNAYNQYKDKGFTVYSVSLDTDKSKWLRAIAADSLIWNNHVSDLKGWQSEAARQYGVRGIPNTFLLDKNGKVLAVNLRGESLHQMLAKLLD